MKEIRMQRHPRLAAVCLVLGAFPAVTSAQTEDARVIEEIVVTARNIEETLREVPVAVTVLDRDTIDSYNDHRNDRLIHRTSPYTLHSNG